MGLIVDRTYGVPVVSHGGSMSGFKSNLYFLPDSGIGAVLLTNSDNGGMLLGPVRASPARNRLRRQAGSGP